MTQTEEILIKMGLDQSGLERSLRGVRGTFDRFKKEVEGGSKGGFIQSLLGKLPGGLGAGMLGGLGIGAAGAAIVKITKAAMDMAHEIHELSEELGVSGETLQAWQMRVKATGGDTDIATKALERLSIKLGDARTGNEAAQESFDRLGISLRDSSGAAKPTETVLGEVMDRMKSIQDPTQRAAVAFDLFGKSGVKVVNALKDGSQAFEDFKKAANGKILSDADVAILEKAHKAIEGMAAGLKRMALTQVAKGLAGILDPGGTQRMAYDLEKRNNDETGSAFEIRQANAKKVAEALQKLEIARQERIKSEMSETRKLEELQKERADIAATVHQTEEGSLENIEARTHLYEKDKEIQEQLAKVAKEQEERDQKKLQAQKELNDKKEKQLEYEYNLARATTEQLDDQRKLADTKQDRSRFTLQELAGDQIGRFTTADMAKQIVGARQVTQLESQGRYLASLGYTDKSQELFGKADKIRSGLTSLTDNERQPFQEMTKKLDEQTKHIIELNRKASAEGLVVQPKMGN